MQDGARATGDGNNTTLIGLEEPKGWRTFEFEWVFCNLKKIKLVHALLHRTSCKSLPRSADQLGHIRANVFVQTASVILAPGWIVLMMLHDASHFQEPKSRIVHFRFSVKNRDFLEACFIETQELQGIHPTKKTKRHPPGNSAGDLSFWDGECMSISSDFS